MGEQSVTGQENPSLGTESESAQTLIPIPTLTLSSNPESALVSQLETAYSQTHESEPVPGPEVTSEPGPEPPEVTSEPGPEPEPIPQTDVEPEPEPEPTQTQTQTQTLTVTLTPTPQPQTEAYAEPTQTLTLTVTPTPTPQPQTETNAEPTPTLTLTVTPTPTPQPQTETDAEPEPATQTPQSSELNLPCGDLLADARRTDYIDFCVPLYNASIKGDWEAAEAILKSQNNLVRYAITENWETPIHVAASAESNSKSTRFVEKLLNMMQEEDLLLQNKSGDTPLCLAATAGNVEIAELMVQKDTTGRLPTIPNTNEMMPLYMAALFKNLEMVTYLYGISVQMNGPGWIPKYRGWVFNKCVEADFFDIALQILRDHPLVGGSGLGALAGKPYAFTEIKPNFISRLVNSVTCGKLGSAARESKALELLKRIWTSIEKRPKTTIDTILRGPELTVNGNKTYPSRILFVAAEMGNTSFLVELINRYPDLIWKQNDDKQTIFHVAVSHRRESIYNLLHEIGSIKTLIYPMKDRQGNNMLHLAGNIAKKRRLEDVSGVAFQMQRELLWFKEVESMIPSLYTERTNAAGKTPHDLFTETHKELVSEGEKWMKGTASKSMVVAALIATIVFGVAYTIPGAYDQATGFPKFRHKATFIVFVVIDAISLVLSSTSILVFLSILTSRYAQDDFIKSLPKLLIFGLSMLFLSIVTMMIAFSVSFFVLYDHKFYYSVAVCISLLALVPMVSYAILHFPLLKYIFHSTYGSKSLFKPKKQMLYYTNPSV